MLSRCSVSALTLRLVALSVLCLLFTTNSALLAGAAETQPPAMNQTFTSLTITPNPAVVGQTVTFTARVIAGSSGSGDIPTGTVTFFQGSTQFGSMMLDSTGTATITSSSFAVGNYSITAMYGGDNNNFLPSTSSPIILIIEQMGSGQSTTTSLKINPDPAQVGATVTMTARVSGGTGIIGNATGTITFYQDGTQIGTGTLDNTNTATFSTSYSQTGMYSISAVYGGDSNYQGSSSSPVTLTIVPQGTLTSTTTSLSSSNPNSNFGDTVVFTATVQGGMGNPPTGTVTFLDGSATLGTGMLLDGVTSYSTNTLSIGTHTITAQYGGDSNFQGSTSGPLTQTVSSGGNQTFIISINPGVISVSQGASGTTTVTVSPAGGFNQPVSFVCSNLPLYAACSFNPPTVTPDGTNKPVTSTLTVTTGTKKALLRLPVLHPGGSLPAKVLAVFSFGLLGLVQLRARKGKADRSRTKLSVGSLFLVCLFATLWLVACGGSGSNANSVSPKGTTIVTVAGSTSTGAQTTTFTLNVQ